MHRMKEFMEKLEECAKHEFEKGLTHVDTEEMGKVIDMIKDCAETMYYYTCYEAMKKEEEEEEKEWEDEKRYYRGQRRDSRGRYTSGRRGGRMGGRRGYEEPPYMYVPDWDVELRDIDYGVGRMYYPDSNQSDNQQMNQGNSNQGQSSRYGSSYDKYMNNRKHYSKADPAHKQERVKMMEEYTKDLVDSVSKVMEDVSQEEKAMLRSKLTKLVNSMQ